MPQLRVLLTKSFGIQIKSLYQFIHPQEFIPNFFFLVKIL